VAFSNAERSWTETYDMITLATSVLKAQGASVQREKTWLVHRNSGFVLLPRLVSLQPLEKGGVRTTTTIQVNHPALVPDGLFEYQHSTGDTVADSLRKGIEQWAQVDFVPLLEALQAKPESCTTLNMTFPAKEDRPVLFRRAVLGPVMHFMEQPPAQEKKPLLGNQDENEGKCDRHDFCPCCLVTNSFDAFKELMEDNHFYGLRLFAARDGEGTAQADCRLNGEDWEKGAQALREYAKTWPDTGYEFRKQYVVLQSVESSSE